MEVFHTVWRLISRAINIELSRGYLEISNAWTFNIGEEKRFGI